MSTRKDADHDAIQRQDQMSHSAARRRANYTNANANRHALITGLAEGDTSLAEVVKRVRPAPPARREGAAEGALRAVIYLRVSTEEQARVGGEAEGFSIPYQREACTGKVRLLDGVLVEEYVDAGESAKSANRPQLQRMLRELKAKQIDFVVVHKIDRLARNRADDVAINAAIAKAGAKLVSVAEPVDETPAGKLLYNMMADIAQYHSDNLAGEVLKGMDTKAKRGGTPYRAPLGYMNHHDNRDGTIVRTVRLDPERAPLIRWAFEQYALGTWSLIRLVEALNAKGLRTRPTPRRPAQPLSLNGLNHVLRSPYYFGVVPYRGVYHEGTHEPIIDVATWLRVQETLTAHNLSGDKERIHHHYLKGSIFCGECGARLVFSQSRGNGGLYEYFDCLSKKTKRKACTRRVIRADKIETAIVRFYGALRLRPRRAAVIRQGVRDELSTNQAQAARDVQTATAQVTRLRDERKKLLDAHYAGAMPLDLMKAEMDRLTREMADAEATISAANQTVANFERVLEAALVVAEECERQYATAQPRVRRLMNQGLFKHIFIAQDGSVEQFELTAPFEALLDGELVVDLDSQEEPEPHAVEEADEAEMHGRERPSTVRSMVRFFACATEKDQPDGGAVRLGLNKLVVVGEERIELSLF